MEKSGGGYGGVAGRFRGGDQAGGGDGGGFGGARFRRNARAEDLIGGGILHGGHDKGLIEVLMDLMMMHLSILELVLPRLLNCIFMLYFDRLHRSNDL